MGEEEDEIRLRNHTTDPIIRPPTRPKSTISSLLSTFSPNSSSDESRHHLMKKKYFISTRFRGLGCTAPAQVSVPAMIRTSANWEVKKSRKKKSNKNYVGGGLVIPTTTNNSLPPAPAPASSSSSSCLVVPDVWCGPGIGLSTDAASVDCVVAARRVVSGGSRGKVDGEKINNLRERRRMVHPEELSLFDDADSGFEHHHRFEHHHHHRRRHVRHRSPDDGLAQIVMLQGNLLMGGRLLDHDRYRDLRLDVDAMSYEELLELGDKIGYVSTGLREDEIVRCVRKTKSSPPHVNESQWKCTICQEEYEVGEAEIGKLECGHFYHMYCIKQWLLQKKTCPICKVSLGS